MASGGVIGRERELAALDDFLDGARAGFACLALEGAPGIGKTTLWEEGMRRARDRGFVLLRSRPAPAETRLAFAGLADLLATLPGETFAELPEPQRRALDVALLRTGSAGRPPERRTIATALLSVVRGLAAAEPILLAIDDAQWLDAPTAAALAFVVRRLADEPVGVVTAVRLTDNGAEPFDEAAGACRRAVPVGPLSVAAIHELLKNRLECTLPRPRFVACTRRRAGIRSTPSRSRGRCCIRAYDRAILSRCRRISGA